MYSRVKVAVIYHSETEQVHRLALAAAEGAAGAGGEVRVRSLGSLVLPEGTHRRPEMVGIGGDTGRLPEATPADLDWADVALFGMATPYGVVLDRLTQFVDTTVPLWQAGRLAEKVYGAFSAAAAVHGGPDRRLVSLTEVFHHWGGIIVPLRGRGPIGRQSGQADGTSPSATRGSSFEHELAAARSLGRRATETARALKARRRRLADVA